MRKKKVEMDFDCIVIPPGSFIIFRTEYPSQLIEQLADHTQAMKTKNISGIILDPTTEIESFSHDELLEVGLIRLPQSNLLN